MDARKFAFMGAAGLIGVMMVAAAAQPALGKNHSPTIVVHKVDPELQRRVSYADLNLAVKKDEYTLRRRVSYTAVELCIDVNGYSSWSDLECYKPAVSGAKPQIADAVKRAKLRAAGLPAGPDVAIMLVISAN